MNNGRGMENALAALRAHHENTGGVVSGKGLEPIIVGATLGAPASTWLLPGRRERGCALLRDCPAELLDEARPYRVVPAGDSPVARALFAVGMASEGTPALVWLGTGSTSYGAFAEALSLTALWHAPVTFVVTWYTGEGPFATQLGVAPSALAERFGLPTHVVDGTDTRAVRDAVRKLAGRGLVQAELAGRS